MIGTTIVAPGDAALPPADPAPGAGPQEVAAAKRGQLMADKSFAAKFAAGDPEARKEMESLTKAAAGEGAPAAPGNEPAPAGPAPDPNGPVPDTGQNPPTDLPLRFKFGKDVPLEKQVEHQREAHAMANEGIAALGLDRGFAKGAIDLIGKAQEKRNGAPMNQAELDRLDDILLEKWGADHAAKGAALKAAFVKAGRSAEWLRQSLLTVDPDTAAWAMDALVRNAMRGA